MMRLWARQHDQAGNPTGWVAVKTAPNGDNTNVWIVNLIQVLLLNRNESPFFANYGIPDQPTIAQQVFPDIYVWQTQQQFSQYFASLIIARQPGSVPKYIVNIVTKTGAVVNLEVPY